MEDDIVMSRTWCPAGRVWKPEAQEAAAGGRVSLDALLGGPGEKPRPCCPIAPPLGCPRGGCVQGAALE